MNLFTLFIVIGLLFSIVCGILWYVFIFFIARAAFKGFARSLDEFQNMDTQSMYITLLHLQQTQQFQTGQQYMNTLDGPVISEIRGMAASEGISFNF